MMVRLITLGCLLALVASCTAVGTGDHTLVRGEAEKHDLNQLNTVFGHLLVESGSSLQERMVPLTPSASLDDKTYSTYMATKFGNPDFVAATLNATVRNRNTVPPFLPIDLSELLTGKIANIALDGNISNEDKIARQNFLEARLLNVPDLKRTTTLHHRQAGRKVYYYYPRISIEFSSSLLTVSAPDRFSFLGLAIKLKSAKKADNGDVVRFIDFAPKAPDIAEYTRGKITQQNQVTAKATAGLSRSLGEEKVAPIPDVDGGTTKETLSRGINLGADLAFTRSETYVNELKDAIEARTLGIMQEGNLFLAEFRSIKNKRIGGTYTFDLMLQVPSFIQDETDPYYSSKPIETEIVGDIYLIAVVRHVYDRGFTGVQTRVPEPENDDTFQQVVYRPLHNIDLWRHSDSDWIGKDLLKKTSFTVTVYTNRDDARFIVRDVTSNKILGFGSGTKHTIKITPDSQKDITAFVEFLNIVVTNAKQKATTLTAGPGSNFVIKHGKSGTQSEIGNYEVN